MLQNFPSSYEESSLLTALSRTDPTAWCFLPQAKRGVSYCSREFLHLWKIEESRYRQFPIGALSEECIAAALAAQGIKAGEFFALVADRGGDGSLPILLVRKDSLKLHAEVSLVTSAKLIVGHLIRFREVVESNVIDAVLRQISNAQRRLEVLSPREREILSCICDGRTNKSISISAGISEKTVEKHRARIMQKLKLPNSAELLRLAARAMILDELLQAPDANPPAVSAPFSVGAVLNPPH